jgi:hypothetical protein
MGLSWTFLVQKIIVNLLVDVGFILNTYLMVVSVYRIVLKLCSYAEEK